MDPNLYHLDWDRLAEVLATIVVLAFVIERALALVFEHRLFIKHFDQSGLKEVIAFGVCAAVCVRWNFDAISMIVLNDHTTRLGELLTGGVIAGGSKASLKLFHDVLDVRSNTKKPQPKTSPAAKAL